MSAPRKVMGLCFALLTTLPSGTGRAQDNPLRIIADTDTLVPGSTSATFQNFFQLNGVDPDIDGETVVFAACCPTGIYMYHGFSGRIEVVVDLNSTFPGSGNPLGFAVSDGSGPSISGRNVAFVCTNGRPGPPAVCAYIDGEPQIVAEGGVTVAPGTAETFGAFFSVNGASPDISGENVAFTGSTVSRNGIYARIDGQLRRIADNTTPVPGEVDTSFLSFGQLSGISPSISGKNVVFVGGWSGGGGVYAYVNGELRAIADTNTLVPGGTGNFQNPAPPCGGRPSIDGENIAITTKIPRGVYAFINGQLRVVADTNTPAPGTTGTFGVFPVAPVISGTNVAFGAGTDIGFSIFAFVEGKLVLIANRFTVVPGHTDTTFEQFFLVDWPGADGEGVRPAMSGREDVVFFGNGRLPGDQKQFISGIYGRIVEPPIPAVSHWGLALLAIPLIVVASILIRRGKDRQGRREPDPRCNGQV